MVGLARASVWGAVALTALGLSGQSRGDDAGVWDATIMTQPADR